MTRAATLLLLAVLAPVDLAAQVVRSPVEDPVEEVADSSDLRGTARSAQARYERRRVLQLPQSRGSYISSCDEYVGRFCTWYEEGDWHPEPEDPAIQELRDELIHVLDSIALEIPGDDWVLGQRVWYRAEGGDWNGAQEVAEGCGQASPWWCAALEGLALHGLGRYRESLEHFDVALALQDRDESRRWRVPRWPVDGEARGYLEDLPEDALNRALDLLWALADPLYLVPGNDRLTAHYARWAFARIRDDARNPFQIPWSRDLDELTVRHGWEIGWERAWRPDTFDRDRVVGHKHPEGRDYMPSGKALKAPAQAAPEDLRADRSGPRSLHAPDYAPLILPAEGQVAVFPRGDQMVVVASHFLPEDTTGRDHPHPQPWMDAGDQADDPDAAGLFLLPVQAADDGAPPTGDDGILARRVRGRTDGALLLRAPSGSYVVSVESWSPPARRAGRHRMGVERDSLPPDLPALSDLLLLKGGGQEPAGLEDVLPDVLLQPAVAQGEAVGLVFEVTGLGGAVETLDFELTVRRADRGFFRRAGEFLGLVDRPAGLSLQWEEQSPGTLSPLFRWVDLELADSEPGRYQVTLELALAGRTAVRSSTALVVRDPEGSGDAP